VQRAGLFLFGGLFVVLLLAFELTGGSGSPTPSVPSGAVALIEGAPPRVRLVTRSELAGEVGREAAARRLKPPPQPDDPEFKQLQAEMLYRLIRAAWFRSEARRLHVPVSAAQIAARMVPEETATLRKLGFTQKEVEEHQRWQLVEDNVLDLIRERAPGGPERKAATVITAESELVREWRSRTFCTDGFLIELCSNFPAFGREGWVPRACYETGSKAPAEACPAPVVPTRPVLPGSVTPSAPEGVRLPQGPVL
jgi:hypothetical protein